MAPSVKQIVAEFEKIVGEAEGAEPLPADLLKYRSKFENHEKVWADFIQDCRELGHGELVERGDASLSNMQIVIERLTPRILPEDGFVLAKKVQGILMAELIDGDRAVDAEGLLERWNALLPKNESTKTEKGVSIPDLGFKVEVECSTHDFVTSTGKKNVASLREAVKRHHVAEHKDSFTRNDPIHKEMTTAIRNIMEGNSTDELVDEYTISKKGE